MIIVKFDTIWMVIIPGLDKTARGGKTEVGLFTSVSFLLTLFGFVSSETFVVILLVLVELEI